LTSFILYDKNAFFEEEEEEIRGARLREKPGIKHLAFSTPPTLKSNNIFQLMNLKFL
jgi:hypothetical protein